MAKKYDFSGWATKNDLICSDGRIIRRNAFEGNDGQEVPLVWNHRHNEPYNVLGHALLENREEGVYAYCTFNDTDQGRNAKELVKHGDVTALSIYANKLKQNGHDVMHGIIREVSLVLSGANPGAYIESIMEHSDDGDESAVIYTGESICIAHSDSKDNTEDNANMEETKTVKPEGEETVQDVFDTLTEKQKKVVYALIGQALEDSGADVKHSDEDDTDDDSDEETVGDVFNTLNEKQKKVVYALIGKAVEDAKKNGGNDNMKHNVFDNDYVGEEENVLSHSDMSAIFDDCKRYGSLKESVLQHGITDIEYLFPDDKMVGTTPDWLKREDSWVKKVLNSTHHTPFSRIKSMYANITADDARAKGYVKGNFKIEEVFSVLKRSTDPQTIYKKQKLDRDDVIDITDFDVVAWIKSEMRMMLDEEIARAILIGDGRDGSSDDKIDPLHIRPIWQDSEVYTITTNVTLPSNVTPDQRAKALIRAAVKARKDYKGTGSPTFFTTEDVLTDMLLMEDSVGRIVYDTQDKLATALRVKEIVTVPVMENQTRTDDGTTYTLAGLIVNLADYNVGADKGGAVSMFDDFDIDYNAQKYLIETRCSGALIKPYSAIAIETSVAAG